MSTLFQVILYALLLYFFIITLAPVLVRFFFKRWINKVQKDLHKNSKRKDNYKKYQEGETEVSYKKDDNIDPGGEYVDFEDLNDDS